MPAREIFATTIVALGKFNPPIFSPDWLERNNLIGPDDAQNARAHPGLVIAHGVSQIECESFQLQVLEERFSLTSKGAVIPALKDMAVGTFSLLLQTPITAVGLNFMAHYKMDSDADYHKIGDVLAPKTVWRELYPGKKESAGMIDVTIVIEPYERGGKPESKDRKQLSVQPSSKIPKGVYLAFNDHHEIKSSVEDGMTSAEIARDIIDQHWQSSWDEALRVFEGVLDHCLRSKIS